MATQSNQELQKKLEEIKSLPEAPSKRWQWRGWHVLGSDGGGNGLTFYFGNQRGAWFISFHFPLHRGWCSQTGIERAGIGRGHGLRKKGGWEYYEPAILTGRLYSSESKWHRLPTIYIPAKLVHLWRLRRKAYRHAWHSDLLSADPDTNKRQEEAQS
jgi:hypothetical protein